MDFLPSMPKPKDVDQRNLFPCPSICFGLQRIGIRQDLLKKSSEEIESMIGIL